MPSDFNIGYKKSDLRVFASTFLSRLEKVRRWSCLPLLLIKFVAEVDFGMMFYNAQVLIFPTMRFAANPPSACRSLPRDRNAGSEKTEVGRNGSGKDCAS